MEDRHNKKNEILRIARKEFARKNYEAVSLGSLAREAGISKPALYYYFSSKEDLYTKILVNIFNELKNDLYNSLEENLPLEERFRKLIENYLKILISKKDVVILFSKKIILEDNKKLKYLKKLKNEIVGLIEPLVKEVLKKKRIDNKIDSFVATKMLLGAIHALLGEEMLSSKKDKINIKKVADYTMSLLF